jgi:hypothetical protein
MWGNSFIKENEEHAERGIMLLFFTSTAESRPTAADMRIPRRN